MKKFKLFFLFFLIFLNFFFIFFYFFKNNNEFEIAFINVGQGNSTIIKTEYGKQIIIDSGNEMIGLNNISKYVNFFNRNFDLVFATHYDIDHVGSFPFIVSTFKIGQFFDSSAASNNAVKDEILKKLSIKNSGIISLSAGDEIIIDKDTRIDIFFPDKFFRKGVLDSNESCLVLKIYYKDFSFLITGDLPKKFEKYLVKKYGDKLKADILVAGHHGSKTANSEEFLNMVSPKYFVISVGKNNSYNLPSESILKRIKNMNIKILRTDLLGNIIFNLKDNKLVLRS